MGARYTRRNLAPGEEVQYEGRPSRIALLAKPVVGIVIAVVAFSLVAAKQNGNSQSSGQGFLDLGVTLLVIWSLYGFVRAYIFYKTSEYVVTDRRVVGKYGAFRTRSVDVLMRSISGITVSQSRLGRVFGYGTAWINGSGTRQSLICLKNPRNFQAAVHQTLEGSRLLKGTAAYTLDVRSVEPAAPLVVPPLAPAVASRFCSSCGNALTSDAAFCHGCGVAVATVPQV